ncbi:MAG: hypothetical protein QM762_14605 [Chryseolinea sp.]
MKKFISPVLTFSLSICIISGAMAQQRSAEIVQAKVATGIGSVQTLDDEIVKGKITFNDNQGIVTVDQGRESRSFTSRKAAGFNFYDTALLRHRVFLVFDYTDEAVGFTKPAFFEVLAEFKSFAVLSKIDPVEVKPQKGVLPRVAPTMVGADHTKVAFQTETIFIVNDSGEIERYLELREKEIEGVLGDTRSHRKKYIDRNLIKEYTGVHYEALESFADTNKLEFNVKEDLIKILGHYKVLLGK